MKKYNKQLKTLGYEPSIESNDLLEYTKTYREHGTQFSKVLSFDIEQKTISVVEFMMIDGGEWKETSTNLDSKEIDTVKSVVEHFKFFKNIEKDWWKIKEGLTNEDD